MNKLNKALLAGAPLLAAGGFGCRAGSDQAASPTPKTQITIVNPTSIPTPVIIKRSASGPATFAFHHYSNYTADNGDSSVEVYAKNGLKFNTDDWADKFGFTNCMNPSLDGSTIAVTGQRVGSNLFSVGVTDENGKSLTIWPAIGKDDGQNFEDIHLYSSKDLNYTGSKTVSNWAVVKRRPDFGLCFLSKEGNKLSQHFILQDKQDGQNCEIGMATITDGLLVCQRVSPTGEKEIVGYNLSEIGKALSNGIKNLNLNGTVILKRPENYYPVAASSPHGLVVVAHEEPGEKKHDQIYYVDPKTKTSQRLPFPSHDVDYSDPAVVPSKNPNSLKLVVSVYSDNEARYILEGHSFQRTSSNSTWKYTGPISVVPKRGVINTNELGAFFKPPAP